MEAIFLSWLIITGESICLNRMGPLCRRSVSPPGSAASATQPVDGARRDRVGADGAVGEGGHSAGSRKKSADDGQGRGEAEGVPAHGGEDLAAALKRRTASQGPVKILSVRSTKSCCGK